LRCSVLVSRPGRTGKLCPRVIALGDIRIFSPNERRRLSLASLLAPEFAARAVARPEEAVRGADAVVCCTTSKEPVFSTKWLAPGALVISIGSFVPDRHEVPASLVSRADLVVVDDVAAALEDAGPIVAAVARSALSSGDLIPLGEIVAGLWPGRRDDSGIVYYNSVGIGVQDAAAALTIVDAARAESRAES
jgi:ornithine cyclodeaminase/alanine dehydrogenase-like protein (mu-crystallin family)